MMWHVDNHQAAAPLDVLIYHRSREATPFIVLLLTVMLHALLRGRRRPPICIRVSGNKCVNLQGSSIPFLHS